MIRSKSVKLGGAVFLAVALVACGTEVEPEPDPEVMSAFAGDGQSADAGQTLPSPIVVRIAQGATSVVGRNVDWVVTSGGGSVDPTSSTTDAGGQARTSWTLGPNPGTNVLEARASGVTGSPAVFNATAEDPTPPSSAAVTVGDNFFDPTSTTVAVGGQVTWTWTGSADHNVTFSGSASPTQPTGSYQQTFPDAGDFSYQCTIHPTTMNGTVEVR